MCVAGRRRQDRVLPSIECAWARTFGSVRMASPSFIRPLPNRPVRRPGRSRADPVDAGAAGKQAGRAVPPAALQSVPAVSARRLLSASTAGQHEFSGAHAGAVADRELVGEVSCPIPTADRAVPGSVVPPASDRPRGLSRARRRRRGHRPPRLVSTFDRAARPVGDRAVPAVARARSSPLRRDLGRCQHGLWAYEHEALCPAPVQSSRAARLFDLGRRSGPARKQVYALGGRWSSPRTQISTTTARAGRAHGVSGPAQGPRRRSGRAARAVRLDPHGPPSTSWNFATTSQRFRFRHQRGTVTRPATARAPPISASHGVITGTVFPHLGGDHPSNAPSGNGKSTSLLRSGHARRRPPGPRRRPPSAANISRTSLSTSRRCPTPPRRHPFR